MKIGLQSVCAADLELEGVIALAKAQGLAGVELATGYSGRLRGEPAGPEWHVSTTDLLASAERAALLTRQAGLEVFSLATRCETTDLELLESLCRAAHSIGCPHVRAGPGRYDPALGFWGSMDRSRRQLRLAVERAREHGVRTVVELHDNTMANGVLACYELVRDFSPREVGIILDAANARLIGFQPWPEALDILGDYLAYVHVKDVAWVRQDDGFATTSAGPGEGLVEWSQLLKLLTARGYQGWLSIEDYRGGWCKKNPEWPTERKVRQWKVFLDRILAELPGEAK